MSTSIPSFASCAMIHNKPRTTSPNLQIRAHGHGLQDDQGGRRGSKLVDSNMKLLKERMEVMRAKERLERNHSSSSSPASNYGWNNYYASSSSSNYVTKKQPQNGLHLETLALVCGTSSLPILIGTTLLCLFSLIAHLNVL